MIFIWFFIIFITKVSSGTCNVDNCDICDTTGNCQQCLNPYALYNNACWSQCDSSTPTNCVDCGSNCMECLSPNSTDPPNQCKTCWNVTKQLVDLYLNDSKCVTECPFYKDPSTRICLQTCESNITFADDLNKICIDCPNNCADCRIDKGCIQCGDGYILYNNKDCCKKDKQFFDGPINRCTNCSNNCEICDINGICLKCSSPQYYISNIGCCLKQFWYNSYTRQCEKCDSKCDTCQNNISCLDCPSGTVHNNNRCCPLQKYFNNVSLLCESCPNNCEKCSNSTVCEGCSLGYYLLSGSCCNLNQYYDLVINKCIDCNSNCLVCQGSFQCSNCVNNYKISNGFCCQNGYFFDKTNQICKKCMKNCDFCENDSFCLKCMVLFNLNPINGVCCDAGYYYDNILKACTLCTLQNCMYCNKDSTICYKCNDNSYFKGSICIDNSSNSSNFCSNATYLYNKTCFNQCPNGYYSDNITMTCIACQIGCSSCIKKQDFCQNCQNNWIFFENKCLDSCFDGYYYNPFNKNCEKCSEKCLSCYGPLEINCLTCFNGYFLKGSQCSRTPDNTNKTLDFTIFQTFSQKTQFYIVLSEGVFVPYSINLSKILEIDVVGMNTSLYSYSLDWMSNNNKTLLASIYFIRSIYRPEIILKFNNFSDIYLKDPYNNSFIINLTNTKTLILDSYYLQSSGLDGQLLLITEYFNAIFYITLFLNVISFLFNPRRESLVWYIIDAFQLAAYSKFIEIEFPSNLWKFLQNLMFYNLDFFLFSGKKVNENDQISYFTININENTDRDNVYQTLGNTSFLINGAHAFYLIMGLWLCYFLLKITLNFFRFKDLNDNKERAILKTFDQIHRNVYFSFNLRVSIFFLNAISFGFLINFKYFLNSQHIISLIISIFALIYTTILLYKCYRIVNNPLVFNDYEQISHYLTLFKDVSLLNKLTRNHIMIISMKKVLNIFVLVVFGNYPLIAISFLLFIQILSVVRYVKYLPFQSRFINVISFITNLCTLAFIASFFRLIYLYSFIKESTLIDEDLVSDYYNSGFVSISFIFMLNVIYLCITIFVFFNTCENNLDCICFFLLEEKKIEDEIQLIENKGEENVDISEDGKKIEVNLSENKEKLIHKFSNIKDCNELI